MSVPPSEPSMHDPKSGRSADEAGALPNHRSLHALLAEAARRGASDLLLVAGARPTAFAAGNWTPIADAPLTAEEVSACVTPILTAEQRDKLQLARDLDFALALPGLPRCRMNIHYQRGELAAALRLIPETIPSFEQLNLPPQVLRFADFPSGLVVVAGGTGHGKSTTLAAIVDYLNRTRSAHIITIEDPVEFCFQHGTCLVEQREIGDDSPSFASALRHVLRQRPDVILIGEMRDPETMATALTAAETGHLVLTTLHTASAAQTLARIIDVFPPIQQAQVRVQLAASLRAILCQVLVRDRLNDVPIPATELLMAAPAIRRAIRDNETHLIYSMLETGRRHGMHTLEQSLEKLVKAGRVTVEDAIASASDSVRMQKLLGEAAIAGVISEPSGEPAPAGDLDLAPAGGSNASRS